MNCLYRDTRALNTKFLRGSSEGTEVGLLTKAVNDLVADGWEVFQMVACHSSVVVMLVRWWMRS